MALIRGNGSLNIRFYVRDPEKVHPCAEPRVWRILHQNPSRGLGCSELQEPKKNKKQKTNTFWCAKSRMRRNETPGRIVTNFCICVGVHDVITSANFYDSCLRGLGVVGVKFWASPLTCVVALTTLALPDYATHVQRRLLSFRDISQVQRSFRKLF